MIFGAEGIVLLLLFAFWIWAVLDCIATDSALCRNLPKGVWLILVLVLPDIGSIAWLLLGRPERGNWRPGSTDYSAARRPIGLEDHPRYSATAEVTDRRSAELDSKLEQWEAEQRKGSALPAPGAPTGDPELDAKQAELDRREQELRRRELEQRERELEARERDLGES